MPKPRMPAWEAASVTPSPLPAYRHRLPERWLSRRNRGCFSLSTHLDADFPTPSVAEAAFVASKSG